MKNCKILKISAGMTLLALAMVGCGVDDGQDTPAEQSADFNFMVNNSLQPGHKPVCDLIGTRSEGWYWSDTGELISYARCSSMSEAQCLKIGSRSEGWYSSGQRIVFDKCRDAVQPTDHRPFCDFLDTRSEGWYWGDSKERISYAFCARLEQPRCLYIGTRSEGWYSNGELIVYDNCRHVDHPTDHRPYCGAIGSRSEGWYWGDSGSLITYDFCARRTKPRCRKKGTLREGWYSGRYKIILDNCSSRQQ